MTYNRKELLSQCLDAILAQTRPVDAIYVIDNASTDGTPEMIGEHYAGRVIYKRLPENTGGAGGFHEGIVRALQAGYDRIWLMDDDLVPSTDCLQQLEPRLSEDVAFLAPLVRHGYTGAYELYHHKESFNFRTIKERTCASRGQHPKHEVHLVANAFLGLLFERTVLGDVLPDPRYFFQFDDTDFTSRLTANGRMGLLVPAAVATHWDQAGGKGSSARKAYFYLRNRTLFFGSRADTLGQLALLLTNGVSLFAGTLKGRGCVTARALFDGYRLLFGCGVSRWRAGGTPG